MSNRSIDLISCDPSHYADYVQQMTPAAREKALQAFERTTDPVAARYVRQKVALLRAAIASDTTLVAKADVSEATAVGATVTDEVGGP